MIFKWIVSNLRHKIYIFIFILYIFANCYTSKAFAQDSEMKNILVLNSYQNGLSWTDHEVGGIITALNNSDLKCSIDVEYMDWKNYPTDKNLKNIYSNLQYKYSKKHLDIIITTDDAAFEFSLNNRDKLFGDTPIVFCGVNENGLKKLLNSASNVTGVVENVDIEGTIQAALKINPELKRLYVIYDNTESGKSTGQLSIQEIHRIAPQIHVESLNQGKYSDILHQVEQVQQDSAILITTYYIDDNGEVVGFEDFSEKVSQVSHVPVYHLYEFGMDHGSIGGSMLFGELQGKSAGDMTVKILHGTATSELPIDRQKTTRYVFDYKQLERFHIALNSIPNESQVLHKPFSFIETYKNLVVTVLFIFLILVLFIVALMIHLRRISRMKQKLYDSNVELTHLYDELATSDEELKQQFEELSIMQRNLMFSEERYVLLFERMLNGFFVFEPIVDQDNHLIDLLFIAANPSFEHHINRQVKRIVGKTWIEVFGAPNGDLVRLEKVLKTGVAERFETYIQEERAYYLINAFRIQSNQVGVVIDNITDYKRAIEEVGQLNEELEQRVTARTNDLQSAIQELESFAYTVSHDLKSPLRAVDGYSKIILEDYEEELNGEAVTMLSLIRGICSEMIDMVNKLLQYSTTTRTDLQIESVDSKELIQTIYRELSSTYQERQIELRLETGLPNIMVDRILMKQALYNILSNAMKFTKDKEFALISVGASITENEYIFYVKDNGVGFNMTYSKKLFTLFQRLHTSDEFEGSGIGLVTIRKIIEKHGGRTWIEAKVNEGATIFFTLPMKWNHDQKARGGSSV